MAENTCIAIGFKHIAHPQTRNFMSKKMKKMYGNKNRGSLHVP